LLLLGQGPWTVRGPPPFLPKQWLTEWEPRHQSVISGLTDIVITSTKLTAEITADTTTYKGSEATAIAGAFNSFVKALHSLLSILIGKASFLNQVPLIGPPVAAILKSIEGVVQVSRVMAQVSYYLMNPGLLVSLVFD
jgi:hypothetical protein